MEESNVICKGVKTTKELADELKALGVKGYSFRFGKIVFKKFDTLTPELIEQFKDYFDWRWLCFAYRGILENGFLDTYRNYINWESLVCNPLMTPELAWSFTEIPRTRISLMKNITVTFIIDNINALWPPFFFRGQRVFTEDELELLIYSINRSAHSLKTKNITMTALTERYGKKLTDEFIVKFKDYLNWDELSKVRQFSFPVSPEIKHYINWNALVQTTKFADETKFQLYVPGKYQSKDNILASICVNNYSENFILDTIDKYLPVDQLTGSYADPNHFINKIIRREKLSISGIDSIFPFLNATDIKAVSTYSDLPVWFLKRYRKYLDWEMLSQFITLTMEICEEFQDNIKWNVCGIYRHQILPDDIIQSYGHKIPKICPERISQIDNTDMLWKYRGNFNWNYISEHCILSLSQIEKFHSYVSWKHICKYQKLSEEFMRKWKHKLAWATVSKYQELSLSFIEEFQDKLYEKELAKNIYRTC